MILNCDIIISELESANKDLLKYFDYDKILSLLHYIIVEAPDNSNKNRCFKYIYNLGKLGLNLHLRVLLN